MSIAVQPLTFEQYMAEEILNKRYDILDGVRIIMPNPTRRHQYTAGNIFVPLRDYALRTHSGQAFFAPCDVLIRRNPLRTRQPDVLFISNEQLAKCSAPDDPAPLYAAPELVVEILSPSETLRMREEKLEDYRIIGVKECWIVHLDQETVEVVRLTPEGIERAARYGAGETVQSLTFPDLTIAVADIFAL